ncbi:MAG: hypothetical protein AAF432_13315 [Planctomycetota bacterium]
MARTASRSGSSRKKKSTSKSGRKSSSKRSKKKAASSWRDRFDHVDWDHVGRITHATKWAAVVVAIVVSWSVGVPKLQAYAGQTITAADDMQIVFRDPPAWLQGDLKTALHMNVMNQVTGNPLDRQQLIDVRATLMQTGWFASVDQVRHIRRGVIEVDASFFMPFATIADADGHHVVDEVGRLLPLTYTEGNGHRFIVLRAPRMIRPTSAGEHWAGEDVEAALRLLRFIDDQPWLHQIRAVDLSGFGTTGALSIISDRGCRIIWGSPPESERALESFAALKVQYLNHHFTEHGHIDRGHHGEVDLTHREAVILR